MSVTERARVIAAVFAIAVLIAGMMSSAQLLRAVALDDVAQAALPQASEEQHTGAHTHTHITRVESDDSSHPSHDCHDADSACCLHVMTCCAAFQSAAQSYVGVTCDEFTTLTPQYRTLHLFVPRLPPRSV